MKNVIIIVQARLGSTRLPSKVLLPLRNTPSIVYQYKRIQTCENIRNCVVAIPDNNQNNILDEVLKSNNIPVYRGSENNVFKRFLKCAEHYGADQIIRINGDCPLISPRTIDSIFEYLIFFNMPLRIF